jgi:ABC transport system ATP-binding/permease protein
MLGSQLGGRFRAAIGGANEARADSIRFAVDFTQLLARVIRDEQISELARKSMQSSLEARTDLSQDEIDTLLDLALTPENRATVSEGDLRAFGGRFGHAEEEALRAAVAAELDLEAFRERYGSAEALLLLDALFGLCAVDGVIDRHEIGRLTQAAEALGVDAVLIGALFRKHDVRHATGDFSFQLTADRYVIGRDSSCAVTLPDPLVATRHAELLRTATGWQIRDLGSGRPTLVNGSPVKSAPLAPADQLRVGSYMLTLDRHAKTITAFGGAAFSTLSVRGLSRKIGPIQLLDDVSFTVFSGEVIAVVGPSGAGKTTLLNAIAGIAPADDGDVLFDRRNFHTLLANDRSLVGIVPQDDVVHAELTVAESLYYSGKLRFPSDVDQGAIQAEVNRVLAELDITHIADSRVGDAVRRGISGGQRKRVNLGQELLTRTTKVLFLDEPTSGLDPQTAQDIVSLIRQLADDGRIVFLVTHDVTPSILAMVDHLMVLAPGGRLAWFGPPQEGCEWFGVRSADEIFAQLPGASPALWGKKYKEGPAYRKFVRTREHLLGLDGVAVTRTPRTRKGGIHQSALRQYVTLTSRYARVKTRDLGGLSVLMAQAPILGLFMWAVFPAPDPAQLFMLSLSALWFGASASVRELISDRTIWRREARAGLPVSSYIGSKVTVLGALVGVQCLVLASMNHWLLDMGEYGFSLLSLAGVTALIGQVGMAMGLLISSKMASSEAAVGTLPLLLIPQITFGGLIVKVKEMGAAAKAMSYLMFVRYGFEATIKTGEQLTDPGRGGNERVARAIGGHLYNLGFKTTAEADDMGMAMPLLVGALVASLVAMLLATALFTHRAREGN